MRQFTSHLFKLSLLAVGVILFTGIQVFGQLSSTIVTPAILIESTDLKQTAFAVLQTKCNVCHQRKNPRRIFTMENMNDLAPKVYKQVFVKRRMPKGKDVQLSDEEYEALEQWLAIQKVNLP